MRMVPFSFDRHGEWVKKFIHYPFTEGMRGIVAEKDRVPVAVVMMDTWSKTSVQVHFGVKDPMVFKHGFHKEVCKYVFLRTGRRSMIGFTPSNNPKALKLIKHFGFTEVGRLKDAHDVGVDLVINRMDKEDCKYLPDQREA